LTLRANSLMIDGEGVIPQQDGVADFDRLHSRVFDHEVILYGFDLLELNGDDFRPLPR
jgi:bifunctional non-homologous end joining protein LigD